jgi:hypothetical protein
MNGVWYLTLNYIQGEYTTVDNDPTAAYHTTVRRHRAVSTIDR